LDEDDYMYEVIAGRIMNEYWDKTENVNSDEKSKKIFYLLENI